MPRHLINAAVIAHVMVFGLAGCSDEVICISVTAECAPLYEPTFDNVFQNTLQPSCGVPGVACHSTQGAQGGLVLDDIDEAYTRLLSSSADGSGVRVDLENPGCGVLLSRLNSSDPSYQMPVSAPLSEAERCSIAQWVLMGAQR